MDMKDNLCCAVIGQPPMRFPWGFDEEDEGCQDLKLALAQKIMELRQQGVTRFAVVADCGIGLYAGECINALRATDADLMLFVVSPHEEQATKWTPDLRNRYFKLLEDCILDMSKEELKALIRETVKEVIDEENPIIKDLADVPSYWKEIAAKLLETGAVNGGTSKEENATDLNLRRETLKAIAVATLYHDAETSAAE